MHYTSLLPVALAALTAIQGVVADYRRPGEYWASLSRNRKDPWFGSVNFTVPIDGNTAGVGVLRGVQIWNSTDGPFRVQIRENAVVSPGDCSGVGKIFNPTNLTSSNCSPQAPKKCKAGDISGKFGLIPYFDGSLMAFDAHNDLSLSVNPADKSFVGGRSIVVINRFNTKLVCVNIVKYLGEPSTILDGRFEQGDDYDVLAKRQAIVRPSVTPSVTRTSTSTSTPAHTKTTRVVTRWPPTTKTSSYTTFIKKTGIASDGVKTHI